MFDEKGDGRLLWKELYMIFDILLIPHPTIHNLLKWAGITDENCDSLNSTEWSVLLKSYQFQHWLREVTDNSIDTDRSISSIVNLMSYQGTSMGKVNKLVNSFLFFQGDQNGMNIGNLDDLRQLLKICQIVLSPKRLDDYLDSLGDVQPNHLKLFEFIDLVQLTIPIPDFALNRQAVLKNPDLEGDPKYFMSMHDLLNYLDSQYMRSVMLETGNILSTQLQEMKKKREKVHTIVEDLSSTFNTSGQSSPLKSASSSRVHSPIAALPSPSIGYSPLTRSFIIPFSDASDRQPIELSPIVRNETAKPSHALSTIWPDQTFVANVLAPSSTATHRVRSVSPRLYRPRDPVHVYKPKTAEAPFVLADPNVTYGLHRTASEVLEEQRTAYMPNPVLIKTSAFPHKIPDVPSYLIVDPDNSVLEPEAGALIVRPTPEEPCSDLGLLPSGVVREPDPPFIVPPSTQSKTFRDLHIDSIVESKFIRSDELERERLRSAQAIARKKEKERQEARSRRAEKAKERQAFLDRMSNKDSVKRSFRMEQINRKAAQAELEKQKPWLAMNNDSVEQPKDTAIRSLSKPSTAVSWQSSSLPSPHLSQSAQFNNRKKTRKTTNAIQDTLALFDRMQVEQERLIATQSTRAKTERLALTKRMRDEKEQARIDALAKKVLSKEEMALLTEREKRQIVAESQWVEFTEELATAVVEMETQHSREVERERAGWDFMTAQTLKFEEEKMGIGRKRRMQTMSARERGGWETDRVSREGRRRSGEGREKPGPKSFEFLRTQMRNTDIDLASEGKWMKEELDADEEAKQKEEQEFQKRAKRREFNHELTKQEEYDRAKWIRGKSPPATPPLLSDRSTVRFSEECEDGEEGQETLVHQNVPKLGRLRESSSSQKGFASAAGLRESREKKRKEEEERKAREEAEKREKERMFRRELDLSLVNMPSPRPRPFTPHTPRTPKSDAVPTSPHPSMTRELGRTAIEERRRREEERKQEIKRKQLEEQRKLENKTKNVSQFVSSSLTDRKQKGTIAEIDDGETEAAQPAHFYELKELTVEEMAVQEEEKKRMLMLGKLIDTDPLPALPSVLQPPVHERLSHPTQVQKEVLAEWMEREREREEEKRKVVRKRRGELVWEREERKREREERMNEELENSKKSERSLSPTRQSPTSPNTSLSVSPTKSATPSSFTPLLSSNLTHTVELREEREEESSMTGIERKRGMGAQTARPQSGFKLNLTGLVRNDRPVTAGMTSSDRRGRSGRSRSAERSARLGIEGSPEREVSVTGRMELNVQEAYQRTLKEETEYEVLFEKRKQRFDSVKTGFEEKHLLTDRPASMGEREKMKEGSVSERRGVERDRKNGESGNRARDLLFSPSPFFDPLNSTLPARIRPHPQSARTRAETNQPQHTDRMNKETGILEDGRKGGEERRSGTRIRPYSAKSTFSPFAMNEQMLSLFVGQRGRKDQAEGERREGREEGEEKKKREEIEIPTNTASILSTPRVSRHTPIKSPRRQHFSSPSAVVVLGAHMSQKQIREQDEREHRRVTKTNVGSSPAPSLQQYFSNIVVKRPAVSLTMGGEAGDMWEKT